MWSKLLLTNAQLGKTAPGRDIYAVTSSLPFFKGLEAAVPLCRVRSKDSFALQSLDWLDMQVGLDGVDGTATANARLQLKRCSEDQRLAPRAAVNVHTHLCTCPNPALMPRTTSTWRVTAHSRASFPAHMSQSSHLLTAGSREDFCQWEKRYCEYPHVATNGVQGNVRDPASPLPMHCAKKRRTLHTNKSSSPRPPLLARCSRRNQESWIQF